MVRSWSKTALVVEDEEPVADLLKYHLANDGFTVTCTPSGEEALFLAEEIKPDFIILDSTLEGTSGVEICRQLRDRAEMKTLPIVMLTSQGREDERIRGLETGADDVVSKPFDPKELMARTNALLRRSRPHLAATTLSYADLEFDTVAHRVRRGGRRIDLSPAEYRLLRYLLEQPEHVFSRKELRGALWPQDREVELGAVNATVKRLRAALGTDPDLIRTVRSEGYSLDVNG